MIIKTKNSTYEITSNPNRIRLIESGRSTNPLADGEWHDYVAFAFSPEIGKNLSIHIDNDVFLRTTKITEVYYKVGEEPVVGLYDEGN